MSRALAALASTLFLAGCAYPGSVQARSFSTGFDAGATLHYRVHTIVTGSLVVGSQQVPLNSDQTLTEVLQVQSVDALGTASVMVTFLDIVGQPAGASAGQRPAPISLQVGADGRILSGAAAQLGGRVPSIPGSDQLTPVLAGHPVQPGDAWNKSYSRPNPYGTGGFTFTARSHYLKDEAVGGRDAAVIDTSLQGPIDFTIDFSKLPADAAQGTPGATGMVRYTGSVSTSRRYWVDLGDHQVLRSTGSGTYRLSYALAVPAGQAGGPQQVDFNGQIQTDQGRI
jgi:hypothetical protein